MSSPAPPRSPATPPGLLVPAVVTGLGLVALLVLLRWVPWDAPPSGLVPVPAEELLDREQLDRAETYANRARLISWSSLAVNLLLLLALAWWPRTRRLVARLPGPWWMRVVTAAAGVLLGLRLVTLPWALAMYQHRREHGLSTQSTGAFLLDVARSEAVSLVVTSLLLLVLVGTARRWPRTWPAVAGAVLSGSVLAGSFLYPVVVEPLFNDFESLPAGDLRTEVLALAQEMETPVEDVLVADASRRTTTFNAWVSGLGPTRRVVLYDTLVEQVPQDQVLAVAAHEIAHARHQDVLVGTAVGASGALTGVGLLGLLGALTSRRGRRDAGGRPDAGGRGWLADPAYVPVLIAVLTVSMQLVSPLSSAVSRAMETRADLEAVAATGEPDALVELQRRLSIAAWSDPTPPRWSHWWWGTHPTLGERVALARSHSD